jgi:hypothetical protein
MGKLGIKRLRTVFSKNRDPVLCCVICGAQIPLYELGEVLDEREDWRKLASKRGILASAIVPAEELELTDFEIHPFAWSFFVRASQSPLRYFLRDDHAD